MKILHRTVKYKKGMTLHFHFLSYVVSLVRTINRVFIRPNGIRSLFQFDDLTFLGGCSLNIADWF